VDLSASSLLLLSYLLKKLIGHFYGESYIVDLEKGDLAPEEQEMIFGVRRMHPEDQTALMVQVKALADYLEDKYHQDAYLEYIKEEAENDETE